MKTASSVEQDRRNKVAQRRIENMKMVNRMQCCEDRETSEDYREPLCIDTFIEKKIFLSFGGPSDGFKLTFSHSADGKSLELVGGVYFYSDWGTYEESDLMGNEAQEVFDLYMGGEASI